MRHHQASAHCVRLARAVVLFLVLLLAPASPAWSQATSLFVSEYVEGSGNNKALEIYNGTGIDVDLGVEGYRIEIYFNGQTTPVTTIGLTGTIPNGGVFVVADNNADDAILRKANQTSTANFFNGNDAVALMKGSTFVDVIGQIGTNPGAEWGTGTASTQDNTLRRRPHVCGGDPDGNDPFHPSLEWVGFAQDTVSGLGAHSTLCVDVAALIGRIVQLEGEIEALRHHTHTYRTGRGAGHNDVEATTGPATIPQ
jgi:predicted extracellular nuclease